MKRSTLVSLCVALLVLLATHDSQAQTRESTNAGASKQDPVVQELLGEVRQLRLALQRMSVNAYRGQIMVERLRLQQEQVNRLTQLLSVTRNQLAEMKFGLAGMKAKVDDLEKKQDIGLVSESVTADQKEMLEDMKRREQMLSEREIQTAAQLEAERTSLTDLNKRLDALELEMMVTGQVDETKERVKR